MHFWSGGMHKLVLCFSLLFSTANIVNDNSVEVKGIEYNLYEMDEDFIKIKIDLYSYLEDIVEMKIFVCDEFKVIKKDNFYSSAKAVKGLVKTFAKLPIWSEEKLYFNIVFYSHNKKEVFENVFLPVYPKENSVCYISEFYECHSEFPSFVRYAKGNILEKYETISLINKNEKYFSFNNILPLEKIKIIGYMQWEQGDAVMNVKNKKGVSYKGIPLLMQKTDEIVILSFENKYYLNYFLGETSENYREDYVYENRVIFPYIDEEYFVNIEIYNSHSSFSKIIINFSVVTKGMLFGDCKNSKYCFRRNY